MYQTAYHFNVEVDLKERNTIRCTVKEEREIYDKKKFKLI
jgi:hypothetical protein